MLLVIEKNHWRKFSRRIKKIFFFWFFFATLTARFITDRNQNSDGIQPFGSFLFIFVANSRRFCCNINNYKYCLVSKRKFFVRSLPPIFFLVSCLNMAFGFSPFFKGLLRMGRFISTQTSKYRKEWAFWSNQVFIFSHFTSSWIQKIIHYFFSQVSRVTRIAQSFLISRFLNVFSDFQFNKWGHYG